MSTKTYGTLNAERRNELSGLEFVQGLANGSSGAAIPAHRYTRIAS